MKVTEYVIVYIPRNIALWYRFTEDSSRTLCTWRCSLFLIVILVSLVGCGGSVPWRAESHPRFLVQYCVVKTQNTVTSPVQRGKKYTGEITSDSQCWYLPPPSRTYRRPCCTQDCKEITISNNIILNLASPLLLPLDSTVRMVFISWEQLHSVKYNHSELSIDS